MLEGSDREDMGATETLEEKAFSFPRSLGIHHKLRHLESLDIRGFYSWPPLTAR